MPRAVRLRKIRRRSSLTATLRATRQLPRALAAHTRDRIYARPVFYSLIAAALLVFLLAAWPFAKDHLEAISVLQQVSGQPVPALVGDLTAHAISEEDLTLDTESGPVRARMYLPENKPDAPALIVLHGVQRVNWS